MNNEKQTQGRNGKNKNGKLIVTRRVKESIILGDNDSKITVLGVKGNQVRIGVEAPKEVPVHREEVYKRLKAANDL